MEYKDTTFFKMLKNFKISRILKSLDFILALILTIGFVICAYHYQIIDKLLTTVSSVYPPIASGMIAIIIASLAIIVSMSDSDFIGLLKQIKIYDEILFIFWYASILAGISIVIDVVGYILVSIGATTHISLILLALSTFFTAYAVFAVIQSIGTVMRYGLYRAEFNTGLDG